MNQADVARLALKLQRAKRREQEARDARVDVERELIRATGFSRTEYGGETFEVEGDGVSAVFRMEQPVDVVVDGDAWEKLRRQLPANHMLRDKVQRKVSYSITPTTASALRSSNPEEWMTLVQRDVVETRLRKVAVTVKNVVVDAASRFAGEEAS